MTNLEFYAIQILVAFDLGYEVSYKDEAEKALKLGKLNPVLTISFINESRRVASLIAKEQNREIALMKAEKYLP